jgi:hypothetical protein
VANCGGVPPPKNLVGGNDFKPTNFQYQNEASNPKVWLHKHDRNILANILAEETLEGEVKGK